MNDLIKGVRVDGESVIVSVKGGNKAARQLCAELVAMIGAPPAAPAQQPKFVGLTVHEWADWWRLSKLEEATHAEIGFADFLMIALAVQDFFGKRIGGKV